MLPPRPDHALPTGRRRRYSRQPVQRPTLAVAAQRPVTRPRNGWSKSSAAATVRLMVVSLYYPFKHSILARDVQLSVLFCAFVM